MCTMCNVSRPPDRPTHSLGFDREWGDASRSTDPLFGFYRKGGDASRSTTRLTDTLSVFNREWRLLCRSTNSRVLPVRRPRPIVFFCLSLLLCINRKVCSLADSSFNTPVTTSVSKPIVMIPSLIGAQVASRQSLFEKCRF